MKLRVYLWLGLMALVVAGALVAPTGTGLQGWLILLLLAVINLGFTFVVIRK